MSIKILKNFDYKKEELDGAEILVRDLLNVNIENWCKFRRAINVGLDPNNLKSENIISKEIKDSYIELAKTHYLIVCHLGILKISLGECERNLKEYGILYFKKSIKEFYFFFGTILDNFARLIYIINDPKSSSALIKKGKKYKRHWIDWGTLSIYPGYKKYKRNKKIKGIVNLRNIFAHSWDIIFINKNGTMCFPEKHRKERINPIWFYKYEEKEFKNKYKGKYIPILEMMANDFIFLEKFQNELFKKLRLDIKKFEKNNNLEIV